MKPIQVHIRRYKALCRIAPRCRVPGLKLIEELLHNGGVSTWVDGASSDGTMWTRGREITCKVMEVGGFSMPVLDIYTHTLRDPIRNEGHIISAWAEDTGYFTAYP
jgi:hypothetical protein